MKYTQKNTKKNDDAVSPVISVVLLVAITVILAAIIASFVFGMASGMSKTKVIAVTAEKGADGITFMNNGGNDISRVSSITVNATQDDGTDVTGSLGKTVGSKRTLTGTFTSNNDVTVVALFDDGSSQVVLSADL